MKNLLQPEQFPYTTPTGWEYDSGDYPRGAALAMDIAGYDELRARAGGEARARRAAWASGISFFTEAVGRRAAQAHGHPRARHGRRRRACGSTRPARPCSASPCQTQGQGHETTFAQIVAERARHRPGRRRGRCTATPTRRRSAWAPTAPGPRRCPARPRPWSPRKVRERARLVAAAMLEVSPDDLEWADGRWQVTRRPGAGQTHRRDRHGRALEPGAARRGRGPPGRGRRLQPAEPDLSRSAPTSASSTWTPAPAQVDGPPVHRRGRLRGADQPDDRRGPDPRRPGRRDRHGADAGRSRSTRTATASAARSWTTCCRRRWSARPGSSATTVTPSPHHPIGAKGIGESATVGSPAAVVNAVIDALRAVRRAARRHAADPGQRVVRHPGPPAADRPGADVSRAPWR